MSIERRHGSYRLGDGRVVFLGYVLGSIAPAAFDFGTGRLHGLTERPDGSYSAGPRLQVPEPVELTLEWVGERVVRWRAEGERLAIGTRLAMPAREVRFTNGDAELAGTLLLPAEPGPRPACVIVHGSGPQHRACVHLIADFLARSGVAALFYDKRGTGASTGDWDSASFPVLAGDAMAGMRLLRSHPAIDPAKVGMFGSSQGGWIVPIAASRDPETAFAILHSAPALPIWRQNLQNVEHSLRADEFDEETIARALGLADARHELWRTGEGWEALETAWREAEGQPWLAYVGTLPERPTPERAERWRRNPDRELDRDPIPFLEQTRCPVLALYGAEDPVVPPAENAPLLDAALARGGNADVAVHVFDAADHLGIVRRAEGGRLPWADVTHFDRRYFDTMAEWLRTRL